MNAEQAKSEIMQIYGMLSEEKKQALDVLMAQAEPCEDAISRQAVLDEINRIGVKGFETYNDYSQLFDFVDTLSSVKPQEPKYCDRNICLRNEYNGIGCDECEVTKSQKPKTGHWIIYKDCEGKTRECTCDQCGYKTGKYTWHNPDFCAGCGARMVEPQESEG